jgi:hypothetical protein
MNPLLEARRAEARVIALEKLKQNGRLIYDFINQACINLSNSLDTCDRFFYRENKWWLRIQEKKLTNGLRNVDFQEIRSALHWLIAEGYILTDNFDKDYSPIKWYTPDKPIDF